MKKVLFWVSLIISLLVLNAVPSFAMGFTVSPEMIGGLGDLGYGLVGGAEFDFSGTEYTIEGYDNLSEQLKAEASDRKAREFLQAYCIARGIPIPNVDPDLPATDVEGFYKSNYFNSSVRSAWNEYKLAQSITEQEAALRFPLGPQSFADWAEYNDFWYTKYKDSFSNNSIVVNPDLNYADYINTINSDSGSGLDFFFSDWFIENRGLPDFGSPSTRSWVVQASSLSNFNNLVTSVNSTQYMYMSNGILTANITGSDIAWIVNVSGSSAIQSLPDGFGFCTFRCTNSNVIRIYPGQDGNAYSVGQSYFNVSNKYLTSLTACLNFLKAYRNINIYVNGVAWSLAGAPADPLIPTFPDVIGGTNDDPYPAYDIVFPNTSDYEGNFDLTSIFDAIKEAIIGASDTDDTTSSTLTRDKVSDTFKDKVGEAVGETTTMDAVLEDSFPLQGTLNYPVLPPIPELPIGNAFSGTTILAQLIDACQQILPEPLVLVFWGIIFVLFIIGLIKILHK